MHVSMSPARYARAAIALHWLLAALLLFQLSLGWRLEDLAGLPQFAAYQLHKSVGLAILLLTLVRLGIRLAVRRPAPVPASPAVAFLAHAVHMLLYGVMIAGPITGWIIVSTASVKVPTLFLGILPWPHLPLGSGWNEPAETAHGLIAWLFVGLFLLHVAGALRHHFMGDDLIARMMPRALSARPALSVATLAVLIGAGLAFVAAQRLSFAPASGQGAAAGAPSAQANGAEAAGQPGQAPAALANAAQAMESGSNAALAQEAPAAAEPVPEATPAAEQARPAVPWQVQPGGRLGFRADYAGSAVDGSFSRWDADIIFSPDDLPGSRIRVTIDLASVDTADAQRDDTLRSDGFFDVAAHPRATFRSTGISSRGGKAYRAAGVLSLHGRERPVNLDFTLDIDGKDATAAGTASLSRTAFGVGSGQWADTGEIKDGVSVNFRFKAKRK
ncbi:YceI family protein [Sphingobium lignivorans]|uniref:Cytochrome b561/polyisoprenoid-binding protein YceI n=1 Tax=Sphingobium lignivorans TaxID=2735886 RepID=A0ABR6NL73_9SPHN|nr:YceI family protein [Sphingobium lignivorans]MBB5988010.1 cytochrome b561/polyisoprenoid-binding protein YceI [Sphingobium lignivorans]